MDFAHATYATTGLSLAALGGLNRLQVGVLSVIAAYVVATIAFIVFARRIGRRRWIRAWFTYSALVFFAVIMALPFYWMLITSLKPPSEALSFPPTWWPEVFRWENYSEAWKLGQTRAPRVTFGRYFYVTVVVAIAATAGALATSVMAGYAFAKMKFWGAGLFFYIMLAMMMIPGHVLLVPSYVILNQLGWLDTFKALIIPWTASMFSIFLLRQFIITIPDDLWDAAQIDGAGRLRFLWMVVIPLSVPAMITAGIVLFLGEWNSLIWPLVMTTREEMRTLQVGLHKFDSAAGTDYHLLMAASTIVIAPVLLLFLFVQRYFIQGIARSGLK